MKSFIAIVMAITFIFMLGACDSNTEQPFSTVTGKVVETTTGYSGRMVDANGAEYVYDFGEMAGSADMHIAVGDTLIIHCETIMESYPMQFGNVREYEHIPAQQ